MQLMMQKRRQSSYNNNINEQQQQQHPHDRITPLPYNTVPIIHHNNKSLLQSSFTKHLQQSSFLFPELKKNSMNSSSSDNNSCSLSTTNKSVATNSNSSDMKIPPQPPQLATAMAATCSSMTGNINSTTCTPQNCNDKKKKKKEKKSVHFNKDLQINYYPPNNKLYHNSEDQISSNNALLWYTPQDYNKFKFQAAKSAGVKLINMVPSQDDDISNSKQRDEFKERRKQLQSSIFVMVGNFDTKLKKENEDTNIISVTAADAISSESSSSRSTDTILPTIDNNAKKRDNTTKKRKTMSYHNENEYNDQHAAIIVDVDSNNKEKEEEVTVCKRGLGYHFSTSRKRTRHTSRLAVLAWQKALHQSDKNDEPSSKKAAVSSEAVSAAATNAVAGGGVTNNKVSSRALLKVAEAAAVSVSAANANAKSNTNSSANVNNNSNSNSNSKSSTELQNDKQLLTLSIISSKCSRTSRHEAIWRGDVDYRIAYPERFADADDGQSSVHNGNQQQPAATKSHGHGTRNVVHGVEASNNMGSNDKKRLVGNNGTTRIKRRKVTTDDSNDIVPLSCPNESIDEALSPETIGYLVKGILHADV